MSTPNLGLSDVASGSLNPSIPINLSLQLIDALLQSNVLDKDLSAPPATTIADLGKRWIVGAAPTGAWATKAGQIALCVGEDLWVFIPPRPGFRFYVVDEAIDYRYNGTTWVGLT